jgi:hypothetical protein
VKAKCPICNEEDDCVEYNFMHHLVEGKPWYENPSDLFVIRMCPNLHFYGTDNKEIKVEDKAWHKH